MTRLINLSLQHNRFVLETKEKEPEIVFIGDSLIQQIANTEVRQKVGFQMTLLKQAPRV